MEHLKLSKKKQRIVFLFGGGVITALLCSAGFMFLTGVLPWHLRQPEYRRMAAEVLLLWLLFSAILAGVKAPVWKWGLVLLVLSVFLWGHVIFLPVAVSGGYLLWLVMLGRFLRVKVFRLPPEDGPGCDFLTGSAAAAAAFCLLSALGAGDIPKLWCFVLATAGILAVCGAVNFLKREKCTGAEAGRNSGGRRKWAGDGAVQTWLCLAFLLTALCIQAGRMNIAPDFDSLWYGLRSPYILDNGRGIYENLGTVGVVYTYSKGLEILTLPLSILPSHGFLLSFQLWLLAGCLLCCYRLACSFMNSGMALFLTVMLAAVPGITNMAVTAKTDIATLLFQLIMIRGLVSYLEEGRSSWRHLAYGGAAFFFTWTLKPTALVFSTAVMGMSVLYFLWKRLLPGRGVGAASKGRESGSLGVLALSLAALAGIWARTVLITGLPVTSVFSSLLTRLGFTMKYPYNVSRIPNSGADVPLSEWCLHMIKRVFDFLLRPQGEDMEHVILAWGGFFLLVMFLLCIAARAAGAGRDAARGKCGARRDTAEDQREKLSAGYLAAVYFPFLAVCGVSLLLLTQVDGNYFMLFYVLTGVYGFHCLARLKDEGAERAVCRVLLPVTAYLTVMTTLTSWSWCVGFTPVSFRHAGYYNHMEAEHRRMAETGNEAIWDMLAADPRTRVIAVGDHPDVLSFPCSVQSYDDITGVWGNVVLVKKMDYFVEFMDYAKTDYVYAQAGYMGESERCYTLIRDLIEYGKLVPVLCENGNLLAKVDITGEYTETSRAALTEFENCYITEQDILSQ